MKQRVFSHVRSRRPLLSALLLLATLAAFARSFVQHNSREGLARLLAEATGQWVDRVQFVWEPSAGTLSDLVLGRPLFFLAAARQGAPRDLFQAKVRLSAAGQPLGVRLLRNVTQTPLGDDADLHGVGNHVVFTTSAYGGIQAITLLDTAGTALTALAPLDRLLAALTAFQQTGRFQGLGQADIVLERPARKVTLDLNAQQLALTFPDGRAGLILDLSQRVLHAENTVPSSGGPPSDARLSLREHAVKPVVLWVVDTVRAEFGPQAIAWLQGALFGAKDRVERAAYSLVSSVKATQADEHKLKPPSEQPSDNESAVRQSAGGGASWPPPTLSSLWSERQPGEGQWVESARAEGDGKRPALFYRTYLRPDRNRPYAKVILIAMDMRQLRLGMQAGYEDPKPLTGPPGSGRLPPEAAGNVVAVFNGAFKTSHGGYGMMVDRRVLVPAVPGAASIVIDHNGNAGFGDWPASPEAPGGVVSFRQNLDPLVEGFAANPTGRSEWGERLAGDSVLTERTALCLTGAGQLYYAWGKELTADTLAHALQQAGCDYAVHLDMNPKHCGFAFVANGKTRAEPARVQLVDEGMDINPERFLSYSPKDFFYLTQDAPLPLPRAGEIWKESPGVQPAPSFLPGLFEATARLGSLDVQLFTIDSGRVDWRVRAGPHEPRAEGLRPHQFKLDAAQEQAVLLAINLGNATAGISYGMAFAGAASLPLREDQATLIVPQRGALRLVLPGQKIDLDGDDSAVQLPLLAVAGKITERGTSRGSRIARAALCLGSKGGVILASAENDSSDVLALALLSQGCSDVVELDRGSHDVAFVQRAGTDTAPVASYESSVLFALDRPMQPHTFRFKPRSRAGL